jgi:hypothetical protein
VCRSCAVVPQRLGRTKRSPRRDRGAGRMPRPTVRRRAAGRRRWRGSSVELEAVEGRLHPLAQLGGRLEQLRRDRRRRRRDGQAQTSAASATAASRAPRRRRPSGRAARRPRPTRRGGPAARLELVRPEGSASPRRSSATARPQRPRCAPRRSTGRRDGLPHTDTSRRTGVTTSCADGRPISAASATVVTRPACLRRRERRPVARQSAACRAGLRRGAAAGGARHDHATTGRSRRRRHLGLIFRPAGRRRGRVAASGPTTRAAPDRAAPSSSGRA